MTRLHTLAEVAADLRASDWSIAELVRQKKVECVRLQIKETEKDRGPIRFTDAQVEQIVQLLTVPAEVTPARRRKRRAS
jgi:hypothetical protein